MKGTHRQRWGDYWRRDDYFIVGVPMERGDVDVRSGTTALTLNEHRAGVAAESDTQILSDILDALLVLRNNGTIN